MGCLSSKEESPQPTVVPAVYDTFHHEKVRLKKPPEKELGKMDALIHNQWDVVSIMKMIMD